jgi:hypothetical protein
VISGAVSISGSLRVAAVCSVAALMTAGCIVSDPELPSVGVRVDAGVIVLLVPACPGEHVRSVVIRKVLTDRDGPQVWSGTGFVGNAAKGIALDGRDWSVVHGSYRSVPWVDFEVEVAGGRSYGTVADAAFRRRASSLPPGTFLVDDAVMTPKEYQKSVSRFCSPPTSG